MIHLPETPFGKLEKLDGVKWLKVS